MSYTTWSNKLQYSATDVGSEDSQCCFIDRVGERNFVPQHYASGWRHPYTNTTHTRPRGGVRWCLPARPPTCMHATHPGPGSSTPPRHRALCSNTTRLSTCTHREGISYMTQMRTQTRGETLCDLVCGWLMDKIDVCRCLRLGAGRPGRRRSVAVARARPSPCPDSGHWARATGAGPRF